MQSRACMRNLGPDNDVENKHHPSAQRRSRWPSASWAARPAHARRARRCRRRLPAGAPSGPPCWTAACFGAALLGALRTCRHIT